MSYSEISDYNDYTSRMNKSMFDKLFFIDKVNAKIFVDYGSADGSLLGHIKNILQHEKENFTFAGYDNDSEMVKKANDRFSGVQDIAFTDSWITIKNELSPGNVKSAVILSSIIHEVYHYSDVKQIDLFWEEIFTSGFDYIIIRDMLPSSTIDRESDINDVMKIRRLFHNSKPLMDFEKTWGSITNNKNLVHFLLKYKYVEPNWDREVKENYIPIYQEDLLSLIPEDYNILYHEHFTLPYIKEQINSDFNIDLKDNTHLKLILKKV